MADTEFVRIAIFRLEDCARRLLELSEQVQSRPLRRKLSALSRDLADHAMELADEGADAVAGKKA